MSACGFVFDGKMQIEGVSESAINGHFTCVLYRKHWIKLILGERSLGGSPQTHRSLIKLRRDNSSSHAVRWITFMSAQNGPKRSEKRESSPVCCPNRARLQAALFRTADPGTDGRCCDGRPRENNRRVGNKFSRLQLPVCQSRYSRLTWQLFSRLATRDRAESDLI